jgi:hypothetical protein
MKRLFVIVLCVFSLAAGAEAKELSVADVLSDPEAYAGKAVMVRGDFLYSEPVRESFTIGEGHSTIEVFYRNLPGGDKLFVSQQKNVKSAVVVRGRFTQYANKQHAYFIDANSLKFEGAAASSTVAAPVVSFFDIQSEPSKYVSKPVTMKGLFLYSEPMRQSFTFEQNGIPIEVIVSDLSKIDRERILKQKKDSKIPVTVSGLLQNYANEKTRFFIAAYTVTLGI